MTSPPRSEHAEALRVSIERLRGLVAAQRWGALAAEQGELERAVEGVTAEAATLRAERDDARTETARAELHLTAARQVLEDGPDDRAGGNTERRRARGLTELRRQGQLFDQRRGDLGAGCQTE